MPLYEYVCNDCHREFESYVRAWGEAVSCPGCEGRSVEKLPSRFALAGGAASPAAGAAETGRACCGGSCGCAH